MVAVVEEEVLTQTQTKTPETLVGLVVAVAVELASLQVMEVLKILMVMDLLVLAVHQIKTEKVKQVLTHHLTLVVMVAVVVHMEKEEDKQVLVELEEIEALLNDESSMTSEVADCIIDAASPVFFDADDNDDEK